MKTPGATFRASHVLVFLVIIAVLAGGIYFAMLSFMTPGSSVVIPAVENLRGRPPS